MKETRTRSKQTKIGKKYEIELSEKIGTTDSIKAKQKRPGYKRPIKEIFHGHKPSEDKEKYLLGVTEDRSIDRIKNTYDQVVKNNLTGEICHEEHEQLSEHRDKTKTKFKQTEIGEIPEDWNIKKLGEICSKIVDCSHAKKPTFLEKSDYIYLEVSNIGEDGFLDLSEVRYVSKEDFLSWTKRLTPRYKDIVITKTGRVGAVAQIPKNISCCIGRNQVILRANPDRIDADFMLFYFISNIFKRELSRLSLSGTILQSLHVKYIPEIRIPVPPLKEQKNISKLLMTLSQKKRLNQRMNKTLEAIAQAIFKHWFIDFEFPNEEGKPYKSSGGEMIYNEESGKELPKGWRVGKLGDIIKITSGRRPEEKADEEDDVFNIPLVGSSKIMGFVKEPLFREPVLIIGRVGTHGVVQRFNIPTFPSDNTLVTTSPFYEYVYQILKRIDYESLNIGSTQPLITQTSIKNYNVVIPDENVLTLFEQKISILFERIYQNKKESKSLSQIRDTLLPKFMSGEIRVKVEDMEET
ncbi:MAG: restriction endonuclease subunit S [Candidatus Heimdallarchaeaceae archaeon]